MTRSDANESQESKFDSDETDVLDTVITSLAELLEEKGVITQEVWEKKIQKNQVLAPGLFLRILQTIPATITITVRTTIRTALWSIGNICSQLESQHQNSC